MEPVRRDQTEGKAGSTPLRLLVLAMLLAVLPAAAQTTAAQPGNHTRALLLENTIRQVYYDPATVLFRETNTASANEKPYSYLWPLCAMLQGGQLADQRDAERVKAGKQKATGRGPETTRVEQLLKSIRQYYDVRPPTPGYASYVTAMGGGDRFYDDNQWIGIALLDAYANNKNADYLRMGQEIYRYMLTGWDTLSGGGIYWKEGDRRTKNTCSNGPGIVLALQLYEATGQAGYLDTAKRLYQWVNRWLQAPGGVYWDHIRVQERNRSGGYPVDTAVFSYNTGIMLQANMLFYRITGDSSYLAEARRLARGSYERFYRYDYFFSDYWFNAVLLRGYEALYAVDKDPVYMDAMQVYADKVWRRERNVSNLVARERHLEVRKLLDQAGMWEIYLRLARYKGE